MEREILHDLHRQVKALHTGWKACARKCAPALGLLERRAA